MQLLSTSEALRYWLTTTTSKYFISRKDKYKKKQAAKALLRNPYRAK